MSIFYAALTTAVSSLEAALTGDYYLVEGLPTNSKVSSELPAGGCSFLEL